MAEPDVLVSRASRHVLFILKKPNFVGVFQDMASKHFGTPGIGNFAKHGAQGTSSRQILVAQAVCFSEKGVAQLECKNNRVAKERDEGNVTLQKGFMDQCFSHY